MSTKARGRTPQALPVILGWMVAACGTPSTNSQTNWLQSCRMDAECGSLACVCGACTRSCSDDTTCADLYERLLHSGRGSRDDRPLRWRTGLDSGRVSPSLPARTVSLGNGLRGGSMQRRSRAHCTRHGGYLKPVSRHWSGSERAWRTRMTKSCSTRARQPSTRPCLPTSGRTSCDCETGTARRTPILRALPKSSRPRLKAWDATRPCWSLPLARQRRSRPMDRRSARATLKPVR